MPDTSARRLEQVARRALSALTLTLIVHTAAAASAPFSLAPAANPLTLQQNSGGTDSIKVTDAAGFGAPVALAVSGAPAGVGTAFVGNLLIVYPPPATPVGSYPLTITGTSGTTTVTTSLTLVITAGATFGLTPAPSSLNVTAGASATAAIGITPVAGFAGSVSFTATGLPTGATATFAPASATNGTTLTVATSATTPAGSYPLTVTGSAAATGMSSAISKAATVTLTVTAGPAAAAASSTTPVNLANAFNAYAAFTNGTAVANGGFDTAGNAFSANLLGQSIVWNGYVFPLGPANRPDSVANATIALPAGNYSSLELLASTSYGPRSGTIVVTYTDGTTTTATQVFSDWWQGASPTTQSGESVALATAYYDSGSAGAAASPGSGTTFDIYGYSVALDPDKVVASVTLPGSGFIKIFSMILLTSPAHATICQTQSGASYCSDQAPAAADAAGYHDLAWVNLQKSLTSLAVSDDQVWGIDAAQILWFLPNFKQGTSWIKVTSGVTQISAGHGVVCQLSTNAHLLCANSANPQQSTPDANGFQNVAWLDAGVTSLKQIAVSAGRQIWGVDANANMVRVTDYANLATTSTFVAQSVSQVAVDGRGTVCQVGGNGNVYCSNWSVPAAVASPAPYHGLPWVATGIALAHITVADGMVWGVDASGNIWQLADYTNSSTWYKIAYAGGAANLSAASVASRFQPSDFAGGDVAVLMIMGQSNSVGHDVLPTRFIAAASPNVWGIENAGWNFLPGNTNGASPAFGGPIASIGSLQWTNFALTPTGADMNLGFNSNAGPGGNAANFAAYQWQGLINAGWPLPDLYIIDIAWPSQGVDPADATSAVAAWTTHGVNLWQPGLTATQTPSAALAPFARTILYRGLQSILAAGKTPRIIGLQWNQWEAEAGNANPISIAHAPANYTALFGGFAATIGSAFPIQFVKPLSNAYGTAPLAAMQTVFANLAAADPVNRSILDVSQVSSSIFGGGVYGGGDGAVHYNLDTQAWFGSQAVAGCIAQGNCGTRITSLPAAAPN